MTISELNDDFQDLLAALIEAEASFMVVGAHALAAHGIVRATGDLDLLVEPSPENAKRVVAALRAFGAPLSSHGVTENDFSEPGLVYKIGLPPRRIDLLTAITGVSFADAWADRIQVEVSTLTLSVLGRRSLIQNKKAVGRPKDLLDVKLLEETDEESLQ